MKNRLTRRHFARLSAAAFGGVIAGTMVTGCDPAGKDKPVAGKDAGKDGKERAAVAAAKHACRGLNECKGQGADGKNACAGQGVCATAAKHDCSGHNQCKGEGGCGETPGANDCKGKGGCHVPMTGDMWTKARESFEARMKKASKTIGAAPAEKAAK